MSVQVNQAEDRKQYRFLDEEAIRQYVKTAGLFQGQVAIEEVSDGKINHVYRLAGDGKTMIFKQAVPYARVVGESMPLPLDRVRVEAEVLKEYYRILPGSVPEVYHLDEELAVIVMEDMFPMQMGRTALINGTETARFASDAGAFSAKTVFYTSDFYMDTAAKKELNESLTNTGMRKLTEELHFDWPFNFHETSHFEEGMRNDVLFLSQDQRLRLEVAKLKHKYMTKADALLHSDLHSGAVFMSEEKTVIFDAEFACFGPFGFDIGQFIANLFLNGIGLPQFSAKRYEQAREAWYSFVDTFSTLWKTESNEHYTQLDGYLTHVLDEIFTDAMGYAGCELVRRAISIAQIPDLNIEEDERERMERRKKVMELGRHLILERHQIHSLEELKGWFI
ncbi:S-methyl-5-thioribose kinase [Bacillus thermotolerans]|uniref:S-methyl-5-thioribose kinase n=1 Tax=Bacillus thermotolerans TaxID=1221996 RepID=UPI000591E6EE|nr:S-methyl-5-thioribose kinase [Bacillus thermotolerans]KKB43085.1 5-methylthioribose kinase [Bacillus thermotolerans]